MVDRARLLLQHWLETQRLGRDGRLPAERVLAEEFGVSRAELRKALAEIEAEGRLIRHVGRGTFLVGATQPDGAHAMTDTGTAADATRLESMTSPRQVFEAALSLEPALAGLAALNATRFQIEAIREAGRSLEGVGSWEDYDLCDAGYHRALAAATGNPLLVAAHDGIASVRRDLGWGRLRERGPAPGSGHTSLAEHDAITRAVVERDQDAAAQATRHHILVEANAALGRLL